MRLSVVVSTLNDRERLISCLDSLERQLPTPVELVVVNGPSSDGTTGAVRERDAVDVLVEISERNANVSRNAGFEATTGDTVAFLRGDQLIGSSWYSAIETATQNGVEVVTGPITERTAAGPQTKQARSIGGRSVTAFNGTNVAFDRELLESLDGFDEYLSDRGDSDCAHRLGAFEATVDWSDEMAVRRTVGTDGGHAKPDWGQRYRSLAYLLAKNYGVHPRVVGHPIASAVGDGFNATRAVLSGEGTPSSWLANGKAVATNTVLGLRDGLRARYEDRSPRRNPNGVSTRHDRAVARYDRREGAETDSASGSDSDSDSNSESAS